MEKYIKKSKFLCWVLRHEPDKIGLSLDPHGWAHISELIEAARDRGVNLTREEIYEITETDAKGRYQISADLERIRALYGHSVPVDLGVEPAEPPKILYHGTARKYLGSIAKHGLGPGRRQFVHLSSDAESASSVGGRHGRAVVLEIDAGRLHADGHELFQISRDTWLTRAVPAEYIRFEPDT
ncbi:MAG: RNA 2'-phosphotransferase [bacterium]|nr:MAG: RNA 2'-phosphotransferase [bacterium]